MNTSTHSLQLCDWQAHPWIRIATNANAIPGSNKDCDTVRPSTREIVTHQSSSLSCRQSTTSDFLTQVVWMGCIWWYLLLMGPHTLTYTYTLQYLCLYTCIHTTSHKHTNTNTVTHTHARTHAHTPYTNVHTHAHMHIHTLIIKALQTHTLCFSLTHTCTHIHTCRYTYTRTYTYTHVRV